MAMGKESVVSLNSSSHYWGGCPSILVRNRMPSHYPGNLVSTESRRGCLFGYFHISLVRSGSVLRGTTMGIHSLLHSIWAVGVDELVLGSSSSTHKALNKKADAPSGESRRHRLLHADVKLNLASTTKSVQFH